MTNNDKYSQFARRHIYTANGCISITSRGPRKTQPIVTPALLLALVLFTAVALWVILS